MHRRLAPAVAALTVLGALAAPAVALAATSRAPDVVCNSVYSGATFDNVLVPPNGSCTLTEVTVLGGVAVRTGGNLSLENSGSIRRSVLVGGQGSVFEDSGWVISGATVADGAYDVTLDGTVHGVVAQGTSGVYLQFATVNGNVISDKSNGFGSIYASTIKGNVVINASTGDPDFGGQGSWSITGPGQQISGNVIVTGNQVPVDVDTNQIKQNLVCIGNNPPPVDYANQVGGRSLGQCATPSTAS